MGPTVQDAARVAATVNRSDAFPGSHYVGPGASFIARLSVAAGLPRLTPHGLRHSFATAALEARVPVEVVAARLGNTPRMVREVCSPVIPADDQAAAQVVGDLFRSVTNAAEPAPRDRL